MINGKAVLAIIPARGGSKGIPRKNIKLLAGKPLIAWTIEEAKKSKYIDRLVVSTDSEEIAEIAKAFGADVPFIRPAKFAADSSPSWEAIIHALKWFEVNENRGYPVFCLLQPTSPFRNVKHIDEAIQKFFSSEKVRSLVSVCESIKTPFWTQTVSPEGYLEPLIQSKKQYLRRQDLPKTFDVNGALYIADTDAYLNSKSFLGEKTAFYEMDQYSSIDIDTEIDFILAETLYLRKKIDKR